MYVAGEGEDQIDVRPLGESEEEVWRAVCRCVGVVPNAEGVDKQLQVPLLINRPPPHTHTYNMACPSSNNLPLV